MNQNDQFLIIQMKKVILSILVILNIQHVLIIIYIPNTMRMLLVLVILFFSCFDARMRKQMPDQPIYLMFSNDGTIYKFDSEGQYIDWNTKLQSRLISFEVSQPYRNNPAQSATYFIPTIEGDFVYINRNKELLVHRQEIQTLLNICLGNQATGNQLMEDDLQQYFLHQKYEFYFIDLQKGKIWNIQKFFQEKNIVKQDKHALLKISKKFLKQMKSNFQVKWSAISSKIDMIPAVEFLKNPQKDFVTQQATQFFYEFSRYDSRQLEITNLKTNKSFLLGGASPVMKILHYPRNLKKFTSYPILMYKSSSIPLALTDKNQGTISNKKSMNQLKEDVFPIASEFKNANKVHQQTFSTIKKDQKFDFEYCLNTFRAIQQLTDDRQINANIIKPFARPQYPLYNEQVIENRTNQRALPPTLQISPITHPHLFFQLQRSKQQPLIWIFIIGSLITAGVIFYRLKVNKLLNQLQKMQTIHDKKFEQIQKKLGQFQQMQKMYEVYWDKLLYRTPRRKASDTFDDDTQKIQQQKRKQLNLHYIQMYQHMIFQGRFLNKEALVYAVPIEGIDLAHIQHQLNDLLSCSHKSLIKLYYYTKNSQFLLIFCQKIQPQWDSIQKSEFFNKISIRQLQKSQQKGLQINQDQQDQGNSKSKQKPQKSKAKYVAKNKRKQQINAEIKHKFGHLIKDILQCLSYLDSKIQIFCLPLSSIILNFHLVTNSQKDIQKSLSSSHIFNYEFQLKINSIPSILQVYKIDDQIVEQEKIITRNNMNKKLRHDLVKLFYFINTRGIKIKIEQILSLIKKQQNSAQQEEFFVHDFYDFVLNENYNFNIEIDNSKDNNQIKEDDKKNLKKFGSNQQFLSHLVCHPFLWDSKRKMLFLTDFSNYIETYLDDYKIKKLESYAKDYQIIQTPWTKPLDYAFVKQVNQFRKYDFNSIKDLIRLIRNKVNHFHEIPKQTRNSIGKTPQAFTQYMLKLYPKLLSFAFIYAKRKKWKLHVQIK